MNVPRAEIGYLGPKSSERPYLWERKTTVCIAAGCETHTSNPKIILCTDWRRSGALGKAESFYKIKPLAHGWFCLTSGIESDIEALLILLQTTFGAMKASDINETNISALIRSALRARKHQKTDEFIGGKFGISYDDFLKIGKEKFPDDQYRITMAEISRMSLGAEFVIAGFVHHYPMLCETTQDGGVRIKEDFATAGEGGDLAITVLLQRGHTDINNFSESLYTVYEAKQYAQRVPSVGEETSLRILFKDGKCLGVSAKGRIYLDEQYKKYGPKDLGEGLSINMKEHIEKE